MSLQNKSQKKILEQIRAVDESVAHIKFSHITVYKGNFTVRFNMICDKAVSVEVKQKIEKVIDEYVPGSFDGVEVSVRKVVADDSLVVKAVYDYIKDNCRSLAHSVNMGDVSVNSQSDIIIITLKLEDDAIDYFESNGIDDDILNYLGNNFCESFKITYESKGSTPVDKQMLELKLTDSDFKRLIFRTFKVSDVTKLFDNDDNDLAMYIADVKANTGAVALAGEITSIKELKTKKDKPYFVIELYDRTGRITGRLFTNKSNVDKAKKLFVGSQIIIKGEVGSYNGYADLRIKSVNLCRLPLDFVPMEKPSRAPADEYKVIFPEKIDSISQNNFLEEEKQLPDCIKNNVFVVLDIETTGIEIADGNKITEIGAVKIKNGIICEKFGSLLNPGRSIPQEIVSLTGITDEMVKDCPSFEDIASDLFKFCDGAYIVAHNAPFDMGYIKHFSKEQDYVYNNPIIDTVPLAREVLPSLRHHKLNNLTDYFGIELVHHRAWNDAYATAKVFLELIKIKKCLPNV